MPGSHFALTHQHSDVALMGRKALVHQCAERLGFAVQTTGLERLNAGGVGFDGEGVSFWARCVLEVLLRRFHSIAAFPTRDHGLDTARPRPTSRTRWRLSAPACAMLFLVSGHVQSPALPRPPTALSAGEDRPCPPPLPAPGHPPRP